MLEKVPGLAICALGLLTACSGSSDTAVMGTTLEAGVDAGSDAVSESKPPDDCIYTRALDCNGRCGGAGFESPWCENGNLTCPAIIENPLEMPCSCFHLAFGIFLAQNQDCSTAEDCMLVDVPESCECEPAIAGFSGSPLAKAALPGAEGYLIRWDECANALPTGYTSCGNAPAQNLRCEDSKCVADAVACASGGDASTDAAAD
jgi:hypothetical protein